MMDQIKLLALALLLSCSTAYAQDLTIQNLLDLSRTTTRPELEAMIPTDQEFVYIRTEGFPSTYVYESLELVTASSNDAVRRPNVITFTPETQQTTIGFFTNNRLAYEDLIRQLEAEDLGFQAATSREHAFREGIQTTYLADRYPGLEFTLTEVLVYQHGEDGSSTRWKRYEFVLVREH